MSTSQSKTVARRFFEDVFSEGNLALLEELIAPDCLQTGPSAFPGLPPGPEGKKMVVMVYRAAFPDIRFTVDEQVAEGKTVMTRWTAHGTHKGELAGIPPTDESVSISGVTVDRVVDGKIVTSWSLSDQFGLLQQLGVIPPS
jgi:steroid delta-isomerase-like uncharacterized protein